MINNQGSNNLSYTYKLNGDVLINVSWSQGAGGKPERSCLMRRFNVTGLCVPEEDYMVDISEKVKKIKGLVDSRCYFTINRARQYGKTTTLAMLKRTLKDDYLVILTSFEGLGDESFATPAAFCEAFMILIRRALQFTSAGEEYSNAWFDQNVKDFISLSLHITAMCKDRKIVLMIDEVDKVSNNTVFVHFLSMLREKFLARKQNVDYTFHSVILAGVYDIKNIKLKMINEGIYTPTATENKIYNSPWNIAANFKVDMSFNPAEIATMLTEYEADHNTGMDIPIIADEIYSYTSGYPFLVSRICQCVDEELNKDWTLHGVKEAAQGILREKNILFDDMIKNLANNKNLYDFLYNLLFIGKEYEFNFYDPVIELGAIYGFFEANSRNKVRVANRFFEIQMYNYFVSKDSTSNKRITGVLQDDVADGDRFDMELCLRKFAEHYAEMFSERDAEFIEREGRLLFLSYLKPLINGEGFYHIESQFTDLRRMDIVVDFDRDQFIIELKLWKGEAEHNRAYEQLAGYMDSKGFSAGYLLTFDFRKGVKEQPYAKWVDFGGKRIFDVVVNTLPNVH
ncbi:MAG: AAA-like domain-containing protein [Oscillospiraceae bacterium]|nr:AAA-like domain-containing protein [Oscillospiraceae bacterium]